MRDEKELLCFLEICSAPRRFDLHERFVMVAVILLAKTLLNIHRQQDAFSELVNKYRTSYKTNSAYASYANDQSQTSDHVSGFGSFVHFSIYRTSVFIDISCSELNRRCLSSSSCWTGRTADGAAASPSPPASQLCVVAIVHIRLLLCCAGPLLSRGVV